MEALKERMTTKEMKKLGFEITAPRVAQHKHANVLLFQCDCCGKWVRDCDIISNSDTAEDAQTARA